MSRAGVLRGRRKRKRDARPQRRRLLLVLLLLAAPPFLYVFRAALLAPLVLHAASALAARAGIELRVERLGGSWVGDVELTGVTLHALDPEAQALRDARVERLHARYSIVAALRGDPGWLRSIEASGVVLDAGPGRKTEEPPRESWGFRMPQAWPVIDMNDCRVRLRLAGGGELELGGVALHPGVAPGQGKGGRKPASGDAARGATASARSPGIRGAARLRLQVASLDWRDPNRDLHLEALEADWILAGRRIVIERLTHGGETWLRDVTVDGTLAAQGNLPFRATLTAPDLSGTLDGSLHGFDLAARFDLAATAPRAIEAFVAPEAPAVDASRIAVKGTLAAPLRDASRAAARIRIEARDVVMDRVAVDALEGDVGIDRGWLTIDGLRATRGEDHLTAGGIRIPLGAAGAGGGRGRAGGNGDAARVSGGGAAGWDWLRRVEGRFDLEVTDIPGLLGSAARVEGIDRAVPAHRLRLRGDLTGPRVRIAEGLLETGGGRLVIERGLVDFEHKGLLTAVPHLDLAGRIDFDDLSSLNPILPPLEGWGEEGGWRGTAHGRVEITGEGMDASGSVTLETNDLVAAGWTLGAVRVAARIDRGRIEVEELTVRNDAGAIAVQAVLERDPSLSEGTRIRLERLHVDLGREGTALDLRDPVTLLAGAGRLHWSGLRLGGEAGSLDSWLDVEGGTGTVEVVVSGLDTAAFLAPFLSPGIEVASLEGRLSGTWSPDELDVETEGSLGALRLRAGAEPFALRWAADLGGGRLRLSSLQAWQAGRKVVSLRGLLPLNPGGTPVLAEGALRLGGWVRFASLEDLGLDRFLDRATLRGAVDAFLDLRGTWRDARGELSFLAGHVTLAPREAGAAPAAPPPPDVAQESIPAQRSGSPSPPGGLGPASLAGRIVIGGEARPDGVRLEEVRIDLPGRLALGVEGSMGLGRDLTAWMDPSRLAWGDVAVRLEGSLVAGDLEGIEVLTHGVRRVSGQVDAAVRAGGTLGSPTLDGHIDLRDGELKLAASFPALAALRARLRLEGRRAVFERLEGELGGAPFRGEGSVQLTAGGVVFNLGIEGENLLLYREGGVKIRADADLRVRGPTGALSVAGSVALRDGKLVRNVDFLHVRGGTRSPSTQGFQLFSFPDPPLSRATFDVDVTAAGAFRIRNNLLRGAVRPALHLGGTGEVPIPTGTIFLDSMRVALPAGPLQVRAGTIQFRPESPFRPELDVTADTRMRGYDIDVHLTGPADSPQVLLSSAPPLPHDRLLLLLLAGQDPGAPLDRIAGQQAGQTVAVFLAQDLLARWFGDESTESGETWLQRVDVRKGTDVTKAGGETMDVSYRLTSDDPELGHVSYLRGEKDAHDKINFGYRVVFRFR